MTVNTEKNGDPVLHFTTGQEITLSPEATMNIVLDSIREIIDYELAVVLHFEDLATLRVQTARGPLASPAIQALHLSLLERKDIAEVLASGKPRLFKTDSSHFDIYAGVLDLPEGHSCLASPLVVEGLVIGLLTLDHRTCDLFTEQVLRFITAISPLIAAALVQAEASSGLARRNALLLAERNRLLSDDAGVFGDLVGESEPWLSTLNSVKLVAETDSPTLLLGETGTGKEALARAIHRLSSRSNAPFVALNCSALPAPLAESELFGHEKGAFTGAQSLRRGRFELAHGGTLFLDEIADLPLEIQPKLLRVLQEGRFERVGGESSVSVDVRVVAATHTDLSLAVANNSFREDLFYRIAVFPIRIPPLRERSGDAVRIAELFVSRLRSRPGWEKLSLDAEAIALISCRHWPGNVRELRNAVERAAILARGNTIGAEELRSGDWAHNHSCNDLEASKGSLIQTSSQQEKQRIHSALLRSLGKVYGKDGAAALLSLKPSTLQSRMKKHKLNRVDYMK
ncbi:sigma 54-interacting transcriptional regulator [Treponema sp.]